jgi:hypothetical protein
MKNVFLGLVAVLGSCVIASGAMAQEAPEWVRIRSITYAGSGCQAGTVAQNVAPDRLAFTLLFDSYIAEVGPHISLANSRRNCQINIDLDYPSGWTYTVYSVDYRGFAKLDPGVNAIQKASYYFQGGSGPSKETRFYGPLEKDYRLRDTFGNETWSQCRSVRSLNINTQVRLENRFAPHNSGLITVDSIDGQVIQTYGFVWRRC